MRGHNTPGAESLWGTKSLPERRKVPTMLQNFFNTVHLLPQDVSFEHGGAKLASCPGPILRHYAPGAAHSACFSRGGI